MKTKPDLNRLIELQKFLLAFQAVDRIVYSPYSKQYENDVEHSYHLAMAAWFLAPHFGLDRDKAIRVALAHDLVEVHAGDTFAFAKEEVLATKEHREHEALDRLSEEWRDFPEMLESIKDYKNKSSEESKFVYALDKVMPAILNYLSGGMTWLEHKVTIDQLQVEKERKIQADSVIYPYYQELLAMLRKTPHFFHQEPKAKPSQQR